MFATGVWRPDCRAYFEKWLGGASTQMFFGDEIRPCQRIPSDSLHWRVSSRRDEISKRIYFDAALKLIKT